MTTIEFPESPPATRRGRMEMLRSEILERVAEYAELQTQPGTFIPGQTPVNYAGRVYDQNEMVSLVDASLEFWLTAGRHAHRLERRLAEYVGVDHCLLVNSGSSANLVAFATLCSPRLGERRIRPGDEVITVAAGFPTTVAPAIQHGMVPVFVDVDPLTSNIDVTQIEAALSPRSRAVMIAHALGNPFDVDAVTQFCRRHGLWLVEDNCDALGSTWSGTRQEEETRRRTGSFGHLATSSFYPPHHITTGEGGAVYTSDPELAAIAESIRDWGRDCYCASGKSNTCSKRFCQQFGELPLGYDHKYVYSHFGYNLKLTDLQAAVGLAQMDKIDGFVASRRMNHRYLRERLAPFADRIRIQQATPGSDPSWFGLLMTVLPDAGTTRDEVVAALESARVQTRMLFAGNMVRQPCFDEMRRAATGYRIVGELTETDRLMRDALWVGVYPGLSEAQLEHVGMTLERAVNK